MNEQMINLHENSPYPNDDLQSESQLKIETFRLKQEIEQQYSSKTQEVESIKGIDLSEQIKLRNQLNLLVSENSSKQNSLGLLEEAVRKLERIAIENVTNSQLPLQNKASDLLRQVLEQESKVSLETKNSEALSKMRAKERLSAMILSQRLKEMGDTHSRITKHHSALLQNKFTSKNNSIIVQLQTDKYQEAVEKSKTEFESNYKKLGTIKQNVVNKSEDIIERMGFFSIQKKNNEFAKKHLVGQLLENEITLKQSHMELQEMKKALATYFYHFKKIEGVMSRNNHQIDITGGISELEIEEILLCYRELIFKENSLSTRYQELSLLQAIKKDEFLSIDQELYDLKKENLGIIDSAPNSTYHETRLKIETVPKTIKESSRYSENLLLLLYVCFSHIIDNYVYFMERINDQAVEESKLQKLTRDFRSATAAILKGIKRESIRKSRRMVTLIKKKFLPSLQRMDSMSSNATKLFFHKLSKSQIAQAFLQFFPNDKKLSLLFSSFIEDCQIVRIFLNEEMLKSFLSELSKEELANKLPLINSDSHEILKQRISLLGEEFLRVLENSLKLREENKRFVNSCDIKHQGKVREITRIFESKKLEIKNIDKAIDLQNDAENGIYQIVEKSPRHQVQKNEMATLEEVLKPRKLSLPHLMMKDIPKLNLHRKSSSEISDEKVKSAIRAHTILQEVLAIDKKMMTLKFKEKLTLKDQAKYAKSQIKIPRKFFLKERSYNNDSASKFMSLTERKHLRSHSVAGSTRASKRSYAKDY